MAQKISVALEYDFVKHYLMGADSAADKNAVAVSGAAQEEIEKLKREIEYLKRENDKLTEILMGRK